jgi:hypothetical protein
VMISSGTPPACATERPLIVFFAAALASKGYNDWLLELLLW